MERGNARFSRLIDVGTDFQQSHHHGGILLCDGDDQRRIALGVQDPHVRSQRYQIPHGSHLLLLHTDQEGSPPRQVASFEIRALGCERLHHSPLAQRRGPVERGCPRLVRRIDGGTRGQQLLGQSPIPRATDQMEWMNSLAIRGIYIRTGPKEPIDQARVTDFDRDVQGGRSITLARVGVGAPFQEKLHERCVTRAHSHV
jgi:hypothetical protein